MRHANFAFGKSGIQISLPDGPDYMLVESRSAKPLEESACRT
jgi:hypothetical protein